VGEPFWSTTTIEVSQTDLKGVPALETATWNLDQHESGSSHGLPASVNSGNSFLKLIVSFARVFHCIHAI
jgi:hypothetical protein